MSRLLSEGVPAAVATGVLYNIAPVLEARAARRRPLGRGVGFGLLSSLARMPLWLVGLACELVGYASQVFALTVAPLALVEPVIASGIAVLVIGAHVVLEERFDRRSYGSIVALATGAVLLTLAFANGGGGDALATTRDLWIVTAICSVGAAILVGLALSSERSGAVAAAALELGAAAGMCYGVSSVATRQLALQISNFSAHAVVTVMTTPTPYLLIVFGLVPLALLQRGYQRGNPALVLPLMTAVVTVVAVTAGVTVFGEDLPGHADRFVVAMIGATAVAGGALGLLSERGFRILVARAELEIQAPRPR